MISLIRVKISQAKLCIQGQKAVERGFKMERSYMNLEISTLKQRPNTQKIANLSASQSECNPGSDLSQHKSFASSDSGVLASLCRFRTCTGNYRQA